MRKLVFLACSALVFLGCKDKVNEAQNAEGEAVSQVEEQSTTHGWAELSLDDWQAFKGGELPEFWKEEDGAIVFQPPTAAQRKAPDGSKKSFNIVSKKNYTNFKLSMEWKISEAGNSGVMWGVSEDEKYEQPYHTGLEVQILDNEKHPDGKNGMSHQAGALYDLVAPSKDVTKPIGEWNTAVISIDHRSNKGSSVLNGVEVATFPVNGEELDVLLKGSKFDGWDGFAAYKTGKLALQDHGNVVAFRNIKIKEF